MKVLYTSLMIYPLNSNKYCHKTQLHYVGDAFHAYRDPKPNPNIYIIYPCNHNVIKKKL